MFRSVLYGAAPLLLALTACPATKSDHSASTDALALPADFRRPGYAVYRGQLAGTLDSITLHLTMLPDHPGSKVVSSLTGSYYGADGEPHEVQLLPTKRRQSDSLLLAYYDPAALVGNGNQRETRWCLRRQPDGQLVGTVGGQPARLQPVRPTIGLAVQAFADSLAAFPGQADSPYGRVSLQTLVPVGTTPVALAVGATIRRQLRGDTLPDRPVPTLLRLWQQQRASFAKEYRAAAASMAIEPAPSPADSDAAKAYRASLRYDSQSNLSVICQQDKLLSLRLLNYEYLGGAHGLFGSDVRSFDLRTGRWLSFSDIFRPEARPLLLPLLERGVRHTLGLGDRAPLTTQLLVKRIPLTTNVCLVPGGVLFVYPPYTIASYTLGEIAVFVPLAAVRPLLREGLPLPTARVGVTR